MLLYYLIGAFAGGLAGYFVLYKLIGCPSGSCGLTSNPYVATVIGILMGLFIVGAVILPLNSGDADNKNQTSGAEYRRITAAEAKTRIDSGDEVVILDVRTEGEYNTEHIPNAILIPNETIADKMPDLLPDLDAEILIYCRSGNRSAEATRKLIQIGYTNVYDFGGINSWQYEKVKE